MAVLSNYRRFERQRARVAAQNGQRLDLQGLRAVAVLTVFANHLWAWPQGGFVGVDIFFVISGFLITGNLLRDADRHGNVSFRRFYWNRVRRIVPAATVVLCLTVGAAFVLFLPFRAEAIAADAIWAFLFMSNWWFGNQGTDYFQAGNNVSPLQHYWSLSIEEQFYFVWPALIFVISLYVLRIRGGTRTRARLAGSAMGTLVLFSLAWAMYQSMMSPAWAYFDTFARVWELGAGALLATVTARLSKIPARLRPLLSWSGIGLITASLCLIHEQTVGFPAPWALLPVAGAALVIIAGVGGEPKMQPLLRNSLSGYVGDISYSLYLVHWPVIVLLAVVADQGMPYYVATVALSFGLAIASFHLVEEPLRRADWPTVRLQLRAIRRRNFGPSATVPRATVGALLLIVIACVALVLQPIKTPVTPPDLDASGSSETGAPTVALGPATATLQNEVITALKAQSWPQLDPPMEVVISERPLVPEIAECGRAVPLPDSECTWGSSSAPLRVVIVGDSIALGYAAPLQTIALNSGGLIQVHTEAVTSCAFAKDLIERNTLLPECADRKRRAVELINAAKPDVVVISNLYDENRIVGSERAMTPIAWTQSLGQIIDDFRQNTGRVVLLSPPPAEISIAECYGTRNSTPADCITRVTSQWKATAQAEQDLAQRIGGVWIDSRPWFCNRGLCPSFVGTTPTKSDATHFSPAYGQKIAPAIFESFRSAGVF